MKTLIIIAMTLISTLSFAQQIVEWKGGTPGKEQMWNEARNWNTNQVPDEYSVVIIKRQNTGHNAQPVILQNVQIASMQLESGAMLTVAEGSELMIDGTYTYSEGIKNFGGHLENEGTIQFRNIDYTELNGVEDMIAGTGEIQFEGQNINALLADK